MAKRNRSTTRSISSDAILSVAKQLFSEKGYRGTSIQDIAKNLKVSKPALYYYFKNKMEILKNLHSKAFEELSLTTQPIIDLDIPLDQKIKKLIENQICIVVKNVELVKIFFQDEREFPRSVIVGIKEKRRKLTEQWIQIYKMGVQAGLFRDIDPMLAVYTIMGACNWIHMWYSSKGELKEDQVAKIVSDFLYMGYSTVPSRTKK